MTSGIRHESADGYQSIRHPGRNWALPAWGILACAALIARAGAAPAQSHAPAGLPPPAGMSLAQSAAMRFPQPVRVGSLIDEEVQQPVESHVVLGTVRALVREADGRIDVVVRYGGWFGGRPIAVPLNAMVVVGPVMEIVAYTPPELRRFPTFSPAGTTTLPPDAIVRIGLAKPSH